MHSIISFESAKSGKEVRQYVAFLHRCIAGQAKQTLTNEQQARLEKIISRRV